MPEPMSEDWLAELERGWIYDGEFPMEEVVKLDTVKQELVAEVRRRGRRIRELELYIAEEAWRVAMHSGTPEQVEKLTTFLIERKGTDGPEGSTEASGAAEGRRGPGEKQEGPSANHGEVPGSTVGDQDEPSRPE